MLTKGSNNQNSALRIASFHSAAQENITEPAHVIGMLAMPIARAIVPTCPGEPGASNNITRKRVEMMPYAPNSPQINVASRTMCVAARLRIDPLSGTNT
jgi:hypothetical protein